MCAPHAMNVGWNSSRKCQHMHTTQNTVLLHSKCCTIHGVPLLATFAAFFFARRPRGTPAGAAETHAPAAPASAPLWAAAPRGCAAQPRVLLRPQQTTAECATAGATSTNATGRRRVAGCDVHVSHSCAGAQAARSHVHESLKLSSLIESKCTA